MNKCRLIGLLLGALSWTWSAGAQEQSPPIVEMTYERALSLARQQAPAVATARARAGEAESQVDAASVWRFNPQVSGAAGPRFDEIGTRVDWSVRAQQWLELGGQLGNRVESARAGAAAGSARSDDARRRVLRNVGFAFVNALYWGRRVKLADESLHVAEGVALVAKRRHEVGDIGGLEDSVAALSVVRARSDRDQAQASLTRAEASLKILLGIAASTELVCVGDLRRVALADQEVAEIDQRPDLRALRADLRQAKAEADLGKSARVPNVALGAAYIREESADIVQGTLTVALPVFNHGQGTTAVAEARGDRVRSELDALERGIPVEVHSARARAETLAHATRQFEREGLAQLARAERLATASYEAGAIPLAELLSLRRELVQAKLDYAALLLEAARARTEFAASTGALR